MSDKTVVLNAKKMNFDGNLDFSVLSSDVTVYDDTTPEQLLERIEGADIIVTKEMPVKGDLIRKFPASVKLICEAGTGRPGVAFQNIPQDGGSPTARSAQRGFRHVRGRSEKQHQGGPGREQPTTGRCAIP
mgnify:CR=1 FL=1